MRPGSGRKPIPAKERLRNRVMFSLRDDEYDDLVEAAGEDKRVATLVREIVLRYLARRRK